MASIETSSEPERTFSIIRGPKYPPLLHSTFNDLIRARCSDHPEKVAVISQHQNECLTYLDIRRRSEKLAAGLHAVGIRRGDRVAVMLGNRSEYVDAIFACSKLGAYVTLMNYAYSPTELQNALLATTAKVLLTTYATSRYNYGTTLESIGESMLSLEKIVLLQDISGQTGNLASSAKFISYHDLLLLESEPDAVLDQCERKVESKDILNLQFTSGSTGLPKAAALTHHGMINSAQYIALNMNITSKDRINIPVPLFHAFGLIIGLCTAFFAGGSVVLPSEYFDASATLRAVQRYHCTGLFGVTTMFVDELSHPQFANTKRSSLRFGLMAGSAMPEELLRRVITRYPIPQLFTNWGMTELSSIATMTTGSDPIAKKLKTAGKLLPNFVGKIVDPTTRRTLPWGQRGEIVISGFGVMHSYYNDPSRTAQAIREHAEDLLPGGAGLDEGGRQRKWMHTGDEGYLDREGYFVITGRMKDLIIRGGENISPLEIEARLYDHPAIKQASVFGVPSARYGEEVAAMLELEDNAIRPSNKEVKDWVRQTLSRYKIPVYIWWVGQDGVPSEWPKTANGKLKKGDIRIIGEGLLKNLAAADVSEIRSSL